MRLRNEILAVSLALAGLVLTAPSQVAAKNVTGDPIREVDATKLVEGSGSGAAVDPVSGKEVDRSTAKVGIDKAGNVYYFENSKNLKQFRVETEESELPRTSRPAHPRR